MRRQTQHRDLKLSCFTFSHPHENDLVKKASEYVAKEYDKQNEDFVDIKVLDLSGVKVNSTVIK